MKHPVYVIFTDFFWNFTREKNVKKRKIYILLEQQTVQSETIYLFYSKYCCEAENMILYMVTGKARFLII